MLWCLGDDFSFPLFWSVTRVFASSLEKCYVGQHISTVTSGQWWLFDAWTGWAVGKLTVWKKRPCPNHIEVDHYQLSIVLPGSIDLCKSIFRFYSCTIPFANFLKYCKCDCWFVCLWNSGTQLFTCSEIWPVYWPSNLWVIWGGSMKKTHIFIITYCHCPWNDTMFFFRKGSQISIFNEFFMCFWWTCTNPNAASVCPSIVYLYRLRAVQEFKEIPTYSL